MFLFVKYSLLVGTVVIGIGLLNLFKDKLPQNMQPRLPLILNWLTVLVVALTLTRQWVPLGPDKGTLVNFAFVALMIGSLLWGFHVFQTRESY